MKILVITLKTLGVWICMPLISAVIFVTAPCYTLGKYFHQEHLWCGFKGAPPHTEAQFVTGLATGILIAFFVQGISNRGR